MSQFRSTVCLTAHWEARTQGKRPKGRPQNTWEKGTDVFQEGETEWSADRSAASDRERWKDLFKTFTSAGRIGSTN